MFCYIDPGTGSMLFTVLIGVVTAGFFFVQKLKVKFSFLVHGGKAVAKDVNYVPYAIFSDSKRYWNVFKPICDEFEKRKIQVDYWTASSDDPALSENYRYVKCRFAGEGNKAFARMNMLKSDICLATTPGLDVYQWKRSANTKYYVHILHEVGGVIDYEMFGIDFFDAILLSGEFQKSYVRELEQKRGIKAKDLEVVGSPYMDTMLKKSSAEIVEKNDITTVLVAPTWGPEGLLSKYGRKLLRELAATGYKIIVRPHPQSVHSESQVLETLQSEFSNFEWNYDNDNFDVLRRSDIMISDVSGVVFDYTLLFDRPLIYASGTFDRSKYDAAWIDGPVWRNQAMERLGYELKEDDFSSIKDVIDKALASDVLRANRASVKADCWQYIGESAKLTVDYLIKKKKEISG